MHIYGGLMWQLGRFFNRPEGIKVYIGSYRSEPCDANSRSSPGFCKIFVESSSVVRQNIMDLPHKALFARVGELMNHLEHLEAHIKLLWALPKKTSTFFFSSGCTDMLVEADEFTAFVANFLDLELGRGHLQDVARFVSALPKVGGLCNLPKPTQQHLATVTAAKGKLVTILAGSDPSMRAAEEL